MAGIHELVLTFLIAFAVPMASLPDDLAAKESAPRPLARNEVRARSWYTFDHDSDHRVARRCAPAAAHRTEGGSVEIALRRQEHERVAHLQDRQRPEDVRHARRERLLGDCRRRTAEGWPRQRHRVEGAVWGF